MTQSRGGDSSSHRAGRQNKSDVPAAHLPSKSIGMMASFGPANLSNFAKEKITKGYLSGSAEFFVSADFLKDKNRTGLTYSHLLGLGFELLFKYKFLIINGYDNKKQIPHKHGLLYLIEKMNLKDEINLNSKEKDAIKELDSYYDYPYMSRYPSGLVLLIGTMSEKNNLVLLSLRNRLLEKWSSLS